MDVGEAPNQVNMAQDPDVTRRLCEAAINDAGAQARQVAELADEGWIGIEQRIADDWFDYLAIRAERDGVDVDDLDARTVSWFETVQRRKAEAEARKQAEVFAAIDAIPHSSATHEQSPHAPRARSGSPRPRGRRTHAARRHRTSRDDGSDGAGGEPDRGAAIVEAVAA